MPVLNVIKSFKARSLYPTARAVARYRRMLWPKAIEAELQHRLLVERSRVFYTFTIGLFPLFYLLDRWIATVPPLISFKVRFGVTFFLIVLLFISFTALGRKYGVTLVVLAVTVTATSIAYLASCSGGFASPYFAGDILPMLVVPFFPWPNLLMPVLTCVFSIGSYLVINLAMHGPSSAMEAPLANLIGAGQIILVATILMEQTRHRELVQRIALKQRTIELEKATAALHASNTTLSAMLDAVDQAFLIFDEKGICLPQFSKACLPLLEAEPAGKSIESVLKLPPSKAKTFTAWRETAFGAAVDFDLLKGLAHGRFDHSENRSILLNYFPVYGEQSALDGIVLVATDKTEEESQARALQAERIRGAMIVKILKSKNEFLSLCRMSFGKIVEYRKLMENSRTDPSEETVADFKRFLHTVVGGCSMLAMDSVAEIAHEMEHDWKAKETEANSSSPLYSSHPFSARGRMSAQLDRLQEALRAFQWENQELIDVLGGVEEESSEVPLSVLHKYENFLRSNLGSQSPALLAFQDWFLKKSAQDVFSRFELETTRLGAMLKKSVAPFVIDGGDVRLDTRGLTDLLSSLVHVFRNIMDHGIETPDERTARGKPLQGQIKISLSRVVERSEPWIHLKIEDDGRGIDPAKIAEAIKRKGLEHLLTGKTEAEIIQLIFQAGLTTKDEVTSLSGRGVGMDAVAHAVAAEGGRISVSSVVGQGASFQIEFPETRPPSLKASTKLS